MCSSYFGEKVALYYEFTSHLNTWLLLPALAGVVPYGFIAWDNYTPAGYTNPIGEREAKNDDAAGEGREVSAQRDRIGSCLQCHLRKFVTSTAMMSDSTCRVSKTWYLSWTLSCCGLCLC